MSRTESVSIVLSALVMLLTVSPAQAQCTKGSDCQIIISGTALPGTPNPPCNPWGLWVWSTVASNGYGNDGHGSMYFYAIHKAVAPVEASNIVLSGNSVSETVSGDYHDGTAVSCTVAAHETSPGQGILDSMVCSVGTDSCSASDIPITMNISNVK